MAGRLVSVRLDEQLAHRLEAAAGDGSLSSVLRSAIAEHFATESGVTPSPGSASFSSDAPQEGDPFLSALSGLLDGAAASRALQALLNEHARDPRLAEMALRADGRLGTNGDGAPLFLLDGEELPFDRTGLYKVLPPVLLKSAGVPGSGSPLPAAEPLDYGSPTAFDPARARQDLAYYIAHKDEVMSYLRKRQTGG